MHPSCSRYSIDCFEKHGLIIGWMMTCDRLFHEPDDMEQAPMILVNGHYKFYDPVENNDFWWYDKRQKAQKAENRRQKTEDRSQRLGDCGI